MTKFEHKLLKKRVEKDSVAGGVSDVDLSDKEGTRVFSANRNTGKRKGDHRNKGLAVSDKPQFKRKKAKVPTDNSVVVSMFFLFSVCNPDSNKPFRRLKKWTV